MEAYTTFAAVYDKLMDNIPYAEWAKYIVSLLHEYNITEGLVAELGCGTGSITSLLAEAGYDMIGIDNSYDMLSVAYDKKAESALLSILYLEQDMREFELFGTVSAIISVCDSLNYILTTEELTQVFRLANNYLDSGGIFVGDFKTIHYFRDVTSDSVLAEDRDDLSYIWENSYDEETHINELSLSLFLPEFNEAKMTENEDGSVFRRYRELHCQRGYSPDEIKTCITLSGMELIAMYDAFTHEPANENSERIYVIARETRQKGKYYREGINHE